MSLDGNKIGKLSSNSGSRQTNDNSGNAFDKQLTKHYVDVRSEFTMHLLPEPTNQKDPVEAETRRSKAFDIRVVELKGEETEESTSPPTPPNLVNEEDNSTRKSKAAVVSNFTRNVNCRY